MSINTGKMGTKIIPEDSLIRQDPEDKVRLRKYYIKQLKKWAPIIILAAIAIAYIIIKLALSNNSNH